MCKRDQSQQEISDKAFTCLDKEYFEEGKELGDVKAVFGRVLDLVREWKWEEPDAAEFVAAMIMVLPFQSLMEWWRPWICFQGPKNSGKTAFLELVRFLYGPMVFIDNQERTEGIRRKLGNSGRIWLIDDLDQYQKPKITITGMSVAVEGRHYRIGGPDGIPRSFRMTQMPLVTFTLPGPLFGGGYFYRSRAIVFRLRKPKNPQSAFILHNTGELPRLGSYSAGCVSAHFDRIQERVEPLKREKVKTGEDSRLLDCFRYFVALLEIVLEKEIDIPKWAIEWKKDLSKRERKALQRELDREMAI